MKKILIVLLAMVLLLAGCGKNGTSSPQSPSDESVADQQEPSSSETEISSEDYAIPGSYIVPDGWEKSEKHSTNSQIFYIEEGHENDEKPDNISIHVGKNKYSLDEHEQFRDAIVQQILMQLDGIEAQTKTFRKNNFEAGRGTFGFGLFGILPLCRYYREISEYAQSRTCDAFWRP